MLQAIHNLLDDKNVLILGFGREGRSTLEFIKKYINPKSVTIADFNEIPEREAQGCALVCGKDYQKNVDSFDVIIKSPGIVYENPTDEILSRTTSQTSLFLLEFRDRTIGITGTKGKSTTTTLIHHVLCGSTVPAILVGNIGIPPLSEVEKMLNPDAVAVFEMSCHQLEYEKTSPHIAVILNLFEDHLDHYGTREKYVAAKRNIYTHQNNNDVFICNSDCVYEIKSAVSKTLTVGVGGEVDVRDRAFLYNGVLTELTEGMSSLYGAHNVFNIATAFAAVSMFNVTRDKFLSLLATYKPLSHRLEYVGTINGVKYYDDSISTVCQTTIQAIGAFDNVETVIVGGMDRGIDYSELVEFFVENPIENLILCYASGNRIAAMLDEKGIHYYIAGDLEEAVDLSVKVSRSGTRAILSPASASYGYFNNFEHRGDMFKEYLKKYM